MTEINDIRIPLRRHPSNWSDIDLTKTITFPHSRKVYKGVPIIMTGRWSLEDVQWLTKHDVLAAHGPGDADTLVDYYTNVDDTHRTIFDLQADDQEVINFFDVYSRVVDKTKMKFVRFHMGDKTTEQAVGVIDLFRRIISHMVVIAGPTLTVERGAALLDAGADVVSLGHPGGKAELDAIRNAGLDLELASLIENCSDGYNGLTSVADVGCSSASDVVKAFACGADFVGFGKDMGKTTSLQATMDALRIACATVGEDVNLQSFATYVQYHYAR